MNILILGSLPKSKEDIKLYESITAVCNRYADRVRSPIDTSEFTGTQEDRYERAFSEVAVADLVVGEQSKLSTGQGMEIRECAILGKPVIVIAKKGSKVSGLVLGCPVVKDVVYYKGVEELEGLLEQSIKDLLR